MTRLVRSPCLTNFADVAARCSLGTLALLKEVGLPARALEDPDLKVPALAVGRLLELAAARGGEPTGTIREVGRRRSTEEATERSASSGGGGGKAVDQEEHGVGCRGPDTEPGCRVVGSATCARSSEER